MTRISVLLAMTLACGLAAPSRAQLRDLPRREPVRDRDLLLPPRPRANNPELDAALDRIVEGVLTEAAAKPGEALPGGAGGRPEGAVPAAADRLAFFSRLLQPRLRAILDVEVGFARKVCGLSDEQIGRIAPDLERTFEAALRSCAEHRLGEQGGWPGWVNANPPHPRRAFQESLGVALKSRVTGSVHARYADELKKRVEDQKRAGALNLVARLDRILVLSPAQRDKLVGSLSSRWNEAWSETSDIYGELYLPSLPDGLVLPYLTRTQKDVWLGAEKLDSSHSIVGLTNDQDAEIDEGEAPKADALRERPAPR
jgi:hypothetical protein